jgi:thiamine biosynthesis lipoprotein ApbE
MFNFKVNLVKKHQQQSDSAMDMFSSAIDIIDSAQESLADAISVANDEVDAAQAKRFELSKIQKLNNKRRDKIKSFFLD